MPSREDTDSEQLPVSKRSTVSLFSYVAYKITLPVTLTPEQLQYFNERQVFWLTPYPDAFPVIAQPVALWRNDGTYGVSQQRDCPGFAPDSLFIRTDEHPYETVSMQM